MKNLSTKIIACILSIIIAFCFTTVAAFADNSVSSAGISHYAEDSEVKVSPFQKLIDFINDLIMKIRKLFGLDKGDKPIVPVENNYADVKINFGAYGDGIHDDARAIQSALDYLQDNGGTIYFPKGTYAVSSCLIFYSNQNLDFEQGAVIKRMPLKNSSEPIELRYLLASYTSSKSSAGKYNGTHDVTINGATFDGNEAVRENSKLTILNLCHTANVKISDCSFVNGSTWHYIECNSSKDVLIDNCRFDATSYTEMRNDVNEIIQIDAAKGGLYGPVYWANGREMSFVKDLTPCVNVEISNCMFLCNGFSAIGCHVDFPHSNISIHDNVFVGKVPGAKYISFTNSVTGIDEYNNIYE